MILGLPLFFLFSVYGVVNAYLPVLLSSLGYSVSEIGLLLGFFEAAGLSIPIFISSRVDKRGNHGQTIIFLTLLMIIVMPPLVLFQNFFWSALFLGLLAVGFKGTVPLVDAMISRKMGSDNTNYGKIRVMGSIGFVFITLLLQFTRLVNPDSPASIASAIVVPALLVILSIIFIPGLLTLIPRSSDNPLKTEEPPVFNDSSSVTPMENPAVMPPIKGFVHNVRSLPVRYISSFKKLSPAFWFGILLIFLGFFGLTPSQRFFSLYVRDFLGLESYAGLWALSATAEIPFMFLSGYFIRKHGTEKLLVVSLAAITIRNLVYALFPTFGGAVAGQLFHSVCFGLFHPAAVVFISERVPPKYLAVGLTLYTSFSMGLASVIGNVIGGFVIEFYGYRILFTVFSFFPLIGIAAFFRYRDVIFKRKVTGAIN